MGIRTPNLFVRARATLIGSIALASIACGARSDLLGSASYDGGIEATAGDASGVGDASFDASVRDSGTIDASAIDASAIDASSVDAGTRDASSDACTINCTPGDIPAPRPIAPLSTSTATSQRPIFRYVLASGEDGAQIDICFDRLCARPLIVFFGSGPSAQSSLALAPGVYFWRLHGMVNGVRGTRTSPAWEIVVGARSASTNASWGTTLDVNADGFPDAIVGAPTVGNNAGAAYLFMGNGSGFAQPTALGIPSTSNGLFGWSVASAGDVNGDGFADVVVGARGLSGGTMGATYVYLGGASGLSSSATLLINPSTTNTQFGWSVASAGDVNGDGYADVVVGAFGGSGGASLYYGGPNGIASAGTPLTDPAGGQFGVAVASAGDVNGDGFADVLVGANRVGGVNGSGAAYIYLGGAGGVSTSPTTIPSVVSGFANFGYAVASAGDVNGDGLADVIISAVSGGAQSGAAWVYFGSTGGLVLTPHALDSGGAATFFFGESVASAGDVNGDGFGDVVVSDGGNQVSGGVFVYFGGPAGLSMSPAGFKGVGGAQGTVVAATGDMNGDGFADFLVGTPTVGQANAGSATLFFGGVGGFSTSVAPVPLVSPAPNGLFGTSLASAAPFGAQRRGRRRSARRRLGTSRSPRPF